MFGAWFRSLKSAGTIRRFGFSVEGDLRHAPQARGKDEMGQAVTALAQLGRTVSAMVANVRGNAAFVAYA